MCVLPWIIEREELDWKSAFMPLNAGFTSSMPLLRTVMSKSCCFGHTQVQARLNGTRGELPCGTRSIGGQVNFFLTAQAYAFIYDSEAKLTTLGIHWLKADPMEQEVSPEQSLCGIRGTTKKNKRNPHSIKRCADTPCIRNWVARAFPIQFSVLYYPWYYTSLQTHTFPETNLMPACTNDTLQTPCRLLFASSKAGEEPGNKSYMPALFLANACLYLPACWFMLVRLLVQVVSNTEDRR